MNRERKCPTGSRDRKFSGRYPGPGKILPGSCRHSGVQIYERGLSDFFRQNPQATCQDLKIPQYDHGYLQGYFRQGLQAQGPEHWEAG